MGVVKHIGSKSEAEILALTSSDALWYDLGFYYPNDNPYKPYYYRVIHGKMQKYNVEENIIDIDGLGITLNGNVIGGVKNNIDITDELNIPENWEYNIKSLTVNGEINCSGDINII